MLAPSKKWSNLPLAVRRLGLWWLFPMLAVAIMALWFKFSGNSPAFAIPRRWFALVIPVAMFTPIFLTITAVSIKLRRMKRAYAASDGRLCAACTHNLQGLGDRGTCPECGRSFNIEADRLAWIQAGITKGK